jgi:hypothetical protein
MQKNVYLKIREARYTGNVLHPKNIVVTSERQETSVDGARGVSGWMSGSSMDKAMK